MIYLELLSQFIFDLLDYLSKFDSIIAVVIGSIVAVKTFRFQSMHTKRLLVIEESYEKIKLASLSFKSLTNPVQEAGDFTEEEKMKNFGEKVNDMLNILNKKRIFFTDNEKKDIDRVTAKFFDIWGNFRYKKIIDNDPSMIGEKIKVWGSVWESADKEIPNLIENLEANFKKTLGLK